VYLKLPYPVLMPKATFTDGNVGSNKWQLNFEHGAIVSKNSSHELCTIAVAGWGLPEEAGKALLQAFTLALRLQHRINNDHRLGDTLAALDIETTQYKKENGC